MSRKTTAKEDRPKPPENAAARGGAETVSEPVSSEDNSWPDGVPGVGAAGVDEIGKLKSELAEAKEKLLYLQADYQNYRKRVVKEIADARMLGVECTLEPFLRVYDFLGMAKDSAGRSDNLEAIRQGIAMIIAEYGKAFDDLNVRKVDAVGKPFDPNTQEAVAHEPSDTVPEGIVVREWSSAYLIGERLLRAAKVVVSAGPAIPAAAEEEQA